MDQTPRWLDKLERPLGWISIPNISIIFITLQALGFLMVASEPLWVTRLALVPELVLAGEYWRLITFLALPISMSPLWVIFVLWFLYFILNTIENEWGSFKTTFYVLVSLLVTIVFSFLFSYPVASVHHFESTLFLAAAALYPNMEIRLFLMIPVKMKWLAWLTLGFLGYQLFMGSWLDRLFLIAIYSNYFLFFGPAFMNQLKQSHRRWKFKQKLR